jgi:hypothetical protein
MQNENVLQKVAKKKCVSLEAKARLARLILKRQQGPQRKRGSYIAKN